MFFWGNYTCWGLLRRNPDNLAFCHIDLLMKPAVDACSRASILLYKPKKLI